MTVDQDTQVDIVEIPLSKFLDIISGNEVKGFAYKSFEMAYSIWAEYKDQKKVILVVGDRKDFISIDFNTRLSSEELKNYGIYLETLESVNQFRNYVIIIPESVTENDLSSYCSRYIKDYLPEGQLPNYFALEKEITDLSEKEYWTELMAVIFPGCLSLNSYQHLQIQADQIAYRERMGDILREAGIVRLDIEPLFNAKVNVSALASSTRNTDRLWPSLLELVDEVKQKYEEMQKTLQPKTRLFLTCSGKWDSDKANFCAYMFYEYSIPSYFDSAAMFESYTSGVSTLQFNSGRMLIEDQITYIKEFPDLSIVRAESTDFVSVTMNRSLKTPLDWLTGNVRVKALEVISNEEISPVSVDMSLPLVDINVYKMQDYFKSLVSNEVAFIRSESSVRSDWSQGKFLKALLLLEESLRSDGHFIELSSQYFVDCTKVLMFEYEGKLYFSYVYSWEFSFKAIIKTADVTQPSVVINVDRDNLHRFLPIMSMPFKVETIQQTIKDIYQELHAAITQLKKGNANEITPKTRLLLSFLKMFSATLSPAEVFLRATFFNTKEISPAQSMTRRYKHDNALGFLFATFYRKEHSFVFASGEINKKLGRGLTFKSVGLWCPKTVIVRQRLLNIMSKNIDISSHRKKYNFFSVFGGPMPIFEDTINVITDKMDITEEFLKE